VRVGIITGSGTYALGALAPAQPHDTRFGTVEIASGTLAGAEVLHVSRHGTGHRRLSSHVNHRANIVALRDAGAQAILAVTVCGAVDPQQPLGGLIVFDDLHFLANRLPDGSLCSLYEEGEPGRGHWVFERPFSEPLRAALRAGASGTGRPVRDGGCYGHVDGPRFNTRAEIGQLAAAGVVAVSQTAGPEAVLAGEAEVPYALLGFATDYANGVQAQATPVEELARLIGESAATFAAALESAIETLAGAPPPPPVGTHFRFS
jgi:purine nucleoside phosphorylase